MANELLRVVNTGEKYRGPDDGILAEAASGLHLDQFERDPAPIGETMHRADRDVDRPVLLHHPDLFAEQ